MTSSISIFCGLLNPLAQEFSEYTVGGGSSYSNPAPTSDEQDELEFQSWLAGKAKNKRVSDFVRSSKCPEIRALCKSAYHDEILIVDAADTQSEAQGVSLNPDILEGTMVSNDSTIYHHLVNLNLTLATIIDNQNFIMSEIDRIKVVTSDRLKAQEARI
jgi:hypothetical protein